MKRVILHIGVENTATTYLQQTFANSRDALRSVGVLHPIAPGTENHFKLAALAMEDTRGDELQRIVGIRAPEDVAAMRASFDDELAREVAESSCETLLLSNEHCSSRLHSEVELRRLMDMVALNGAAITVIVYLRRQDEALLSMYSTSVRSGSSAPLAYPSEYAIAARFDYEALLRPWAAVFGKENIVVRVFNQLERGGIVADFEKAAALPAGIGWLEPKDRLNARLDARQTEYLRLLNGFFPELTKENDATRRGNLAAVTAQVEGPNTPLALAPGMAAALLEAVRASNGAVAREYLGRELPGDPLFGEIDIALGTEPYVMTLEEFASMTADVWVIKHQQSRYLVNRLRDAWKLNGKG